MRRGLPLLGLILVVALGGLAAWLLADRRSSSSGPVTQARRVPTRADPRLTRRVRKRLPLQLVERRTGLLPAPVQDAAAAEVGNRRAALLGGLTAADTSTDSILVAGPTGARRNGRLPAALHDSAAAAIGGSVYLFGGGDGVRQLDTIVRVDPGSGGAAATGRLPAPSSDQAAAVVGGTAYVIGGYTGARWLDSIVAWRPGSRSRVVAHLPSALRYAAVTAVGKAVVIAGG